MISLFIGLCAYSQNYVLKSYSFNLGGISTSAAINNILGVTIGELMAGRISNENYTLEAGFWHSKKRENMGLSTDEIIDLIKKKRNEFMLGQNKPNPVKEKTLIEFSLPKDCWVRMELYDRSGRLTGILIDKAMKKGRNQYGLNVSGLSSGIYFYRLKADKFIMTKKLIKVK